MNPELGIAFIYCDNCGMVVSFRSLEGELTLAQTHERFNRRALDRGTLLYLREQMEANAMHGAVGIIDDELEKLK